MIQRHSISHTGVYCVFSKKCENYGTFKVVTLACPFRTNMWHVHFDFATQIFYFYFVETRYS